MDKKREPASRRGMKLRRYTEHQRAKAVADVPTLGIAGAARKHNVPQPNVARWMKANPPPRKSDARTASKRIATRAPSTATSAPRIIAKTPPAKKIARSYTPSQRAEAIEYAAEHGVAAASEKFGMSRFSIYEWQRKLARAAAGLGSSPTSGPSVAGIETQRDREILGEWKLHPGLGPSQIRNQLRRKNIKVSVRTARIVMETAGYRPPKVERHPHDQRFEAVRPNHLWHLDFMHRHIHIANTFTLILIDDHSRFVVGHGVDDAERADMVIQTFERAVTRYGRPEIVMHDRGSAFWAWKGISRFTALMTEMGIDQFVAAEKETNGKIEVFNANLAKELFDVHRFADVGEMRRRLDTHLHWYNHGRTHHALGGLLVPADRYYGRVDEVLARIEAGAGRDIGDGIDLRTRSLDFFKVVSHDGVTEVWLLGKKLLELRP
ncbi:MAG TPA: DDE-type integrase/transposase/recombinase [Casimicrobiaceae bacterium]|nr:DDE-type integrase/transposase/recombinase [Casimicrobiaceae bacterium]